MPLMSSYTQKSGTTEDAGGTLKSNADEKQQIGSQRWFKNLYKFVESFELRAWYVDYIHPRPNFVFFKKETKTKSEKPVL